MSSAENGRRVAIVADGSSYVGPSLAPILAARGHDIVVGQPAPGLVDELSALGAAVVSVDGVRDLSDPAASERLVGAALERFGRVDSAVAFSGRIVTGRFTNSNVDDFRAV